MYSLDRETSHISRPNGRYVLQIHAQPHAAPHMRCTYHRPQLWMYDTVQFKRGVVRTITGQAWNALQWRRLSIFKASCFRGPPMWIWHWAAAVSYSKVAGIKRRHRWNNRCCVIVLPRWCDGVWEWSERTRRLCVTTSTQRSVRPSSPLPRAQARARGLGCLDFLLCERTTQMKAGENDTIERSWGQSLHSPVVLSC